MKKIVITGAILGSLFAAQGVSAAEYTVKSGDTLWNISTNFKVSVSEIKTQNQLTSDIIFPGQVLKIGETVTETNPVTTQPSIQKYTVQSGDYLGTIAKKFSTTTTNLLTINPDITNPDVLKIGQVINVPTVNSVTSTPAPTSNTNTTVSSNVYVVQAGDTFGAIAKKYNMTITQLLSLNPQISNVDLLSVGQKVNVPTAQTTPTVPNTITTPTTPEQPVVPSVDWEQVANAVIESGKKYLGAPYQFGASPTQTSTFDCSSFTQRVFGENGITLPRTSVQQSQMGATIPLSEARKGDLLFFDTDYDGVINHVSIFVDSSTVLHAATSKGVSFANTQYYWMPRYVKAVRVIN